MKKIFVSSPFSLKTSLEVASEVTFPVNSGRGYEMIKELIHSIPHTLTSLSIFISEDTVKYLNTCIESFKHTHTFFWIREDFSKAILELERQLKSNNQ